MAKIFYLILNILFDTMDNANSCNYPRG